VRTTTIAQFYVSDATFSGAGPDTQYQSRYTKEFVTANFYSAVYTEGTGNYTSASPAQTGNYTSLLYYLGSYQATSDENFLAQYAEIYSGQSYLSDYAGDTPGVFYNISYLSVFDPPEYNRLFTRQYTGGFAVTNYVGSYQIDYQGLYESIYTNVFLNSYISNYDNTFDNFFDAQYQQDYLGNFEGNFAGETIQASNQTEETYTLYVRIG
jgi:hypothetical protein